MGDTSLRRASGVLARVRKSGSTLPGRRIPAAMLSLWTSSPRWVVLFMAGPPYVARAAGLSRDQSTNPCGRGRPLESVHMMTRRERDRRSVPHGLHAPLHLVGSHIFDMRGNVPPMAEGVLELARAVAVELVLDRSQGLGPRLDGLLENCIGVFHIDIHGHRTAAQRLGALNAHLRKLVREHDHRVAEGKLRVADLVVGGVHSHRLGGTEHLGVEDDGVAGPVDAEIRSDLRVLVGNRLHVCHGVSSGWSEWVAFEEATE